MAEWLHPTVPPQLIGCSETILWKDFPEHFMTFTNYITATERQRVHLIKYKELFSRCRCVRPSLFCCAGIYELLPGKMKEEQTVHRPEVWLEQRQPLIPLRLGNKPLRIPNFPLTNASGAAHRLSDWELKLKEGWQLPLCLNLQNHVDEVLIFTASLSGIHGSVQREL